METLIDLECRCFCNWRAKVWFKTSREFNRQQMTEAVALAHKTIKVYAAVNGLFHNYHLDAVEDYINFYMKYELTELFSGIQQ